MRRPKWSALDHFVDQLRNIGGIQYVDSALSEQAHRHFNYDYNLTSKRPGTLITASVRKQELKTENELYSSLRSLEKLVEAESPLCKDTKNTKLHFLLPPWFTKLKKTSFTKFKKREEQ